MRLSDIGTFAIVLEKVPIGFQKKSRVICCPTIGIGAGPHCSGHVLVTNVAGINAQFSPKFLKRYLNGRDLIFDALRQFKSDIESRISTKDHGYSNETCQQLTKKLRILPQYLRRRFPLCLWSHSV